jgi:hypothetical protein
MIWIIKERYEHISGYGSRSIQNHHHLLHGLGHKLSVPSSWKVCWFLHGNYGRSVFRFLFGLCSNIQDHLHLKPRGQWNRRFDAGLKFSPYNDFGHLRLILNKFSFIIIKWTVWASHRSQTVNILGSNLDSETGHPDRLIAVYLILGHGYSRPHPFLFIIH